MRGEVGSMSDVEPTTPPPGRRNRPRSRRHASAIDSPGDDSGWLQFPAQIDADDLPLLGLVPQMEWIAGCLASDGLDPEPLVKALPAAIPTGP